LVLLINLNGAVQRLEREREIQRRDDDVVVVGLALSSVYLLRLLLTFPVECAISLSLIDTLVDSLTK